MTAQAQIKRGTHKASPKKLLFGDNKYSTSSDQMKLFDIAIKMRRSGLSEDFIVNAVKTALKFEGVADLMHLWLDEKDSKERGEIIADIQDMMDACSQKEKYEEIYIKFNDLDAIAKNIRAFKDSLYQEVMKRGGISKLAEVIGIPQPSLSRFFNSNAMPRRGTVLKIAKALNLDEIKIDILWSK
ncbi:MAG: helix-turn-helix transcriptional regulator [Gammaproteobacteria bacterium]|nr:helix-turn-helix transcriptional regulator [Gammaproteobacteria bacterium]